MIKLVTSIAAAATVIGAVGLTVAQAQSTNNMPPNKGIEATGAMRPAPSPGTPVTKPSAAMPDNSAPVQEAAPQADRG